MKKEKHLVTIFQIKDIVCFTTLFFAMITLTFGQVSMGSIIDNTNKALPSSYNFKEYVFAEPNDQGSCIGAVNNTAKIDEIFMAQTHRHAIDHPLFFTIGHRPALFQVAVTGSGISPDVQVQGFFEGESIGVLCLSGPALLQETIDLKTPNFEDYFSVTLPKNWIKNGLELVVMAGNETQRITAETLKIGPYTELNLVMVNMDVMDYNDDPHFFPIFENFLEEVASAIPASVVRFGIFPETLKFPEYVVRNDAFEAVKLTKVDDIWVNDISNEGTINAMADDFLKLMHQSTGDYLSTIYFGNTLNLAPGGWGNGRSFVSPDFTDIFIHELGHALSLPHWSNAFFLADGPLDEYNYPYGGDTNDGASRGETWNFIQDTYEFETPFCKDLGPNNEGVERSDAMQREYSCLAERTNGLGVWDGFGDFSAIAIHRFLAGGKQIKGKVPYRGGEVDYNLEAQAGYPNASLQDGSRFYVKDPEQPQEEPYLIEFKLPGKELWEQDVYLVYGTAHSLDESLTVVYEPIKYKGALPPIIDPTNAETFTMLKTLDENSGFGLYDSDRNLTVKLTYEDGSILHALVPFTSLSPVEDDSNPFTLVVPAQKILCGVEVFVRPFIISDEDFEIAGNINNSALNITPANFMDTARLLGKYDCGLISEVGVTVPQKTIFYPNPFNNSLNVDASDTKGGTLNIYNVLGQRVARHNLNSTTSVIPTVALSSGLYIAVHKDSKGAVTNSEKLIRQ